MHARTSELLDYLQQQRAVLKGAFEAVPVPLRNQPPAPDRWSATNVIEHLSIVNRRFAILLTRQIAAARAAGLAAETNSDPVLPTLDVTHVTDRTTRFNASETSTPTGLDADAAWAALNDATEALNQMILSGDGLALSEVTHPHPRLGPMSVYQWIAFIGAHEARHAAQIRENIQ